MTVPQRDSGFLGELPRVDRLESRGLTRDEALREMLAKYMEGMHANEPVHTWELPKES